MSTSDVHVVILERIDTHISKAIEKHADAAEKHDEILAKLDELLSR